MKKIQTLLTKAFPKLDWQFNVELAPFTYMKIGGPADAVVVTKTVKDVTSLTSFCYQNDIPVTILGGASNVIVDDKGVKGVVIRIANESVEQLEHDSTFTIVRAGAGVKMAPLVAKTVEMGLTGLEYFLGVPGTVGGAIYNNAHYLSDLIGEHVAAVHVVSKDGKIAWIAVKDCAFAYEHSRFQKTGEIILEVNFRLKTGSKKESQEKIKHATEYRAKTQPLGIPSSGCIFQNVKNTEKLKKTFPDFADKPHVPGGYIIDQAGLKSTKVGGIQVSTKHAAWFENDGTGTSDDVKKLIKKVKDTVKSKFDVELHEEVFFVK